MKIKIVFELNERDRKAVANHFGKAKVSYAECKTLIDNTIKTLFEDLHFDLDKSEEGEAEVAKEKV